MHTFSVIFAVSFIVMNYFYSLYTFNKFSYILGVDNLSLYYFHAFSFKFLHIFDQLSVILRRSKFFSRVITRFLNIFRRDKLFYFSHIFNFFHILHIKIFLSYTSSFIFFVTDFFGQFPHILSLYNFFLTS